MKKKKYHYEENQDLIEVLIEVGITQREKLLKIMSESYAAETLVAANVLDRDLPDDEIRRRYLNILEGLSFGRLIGTIAASSENARENILKLTEGSDLYDAFADILDNWKGDTDEKFLMECFKETLQGMVEDGIAEEDTVDRAFLN